MFENLDAGGTEERFKFIEQAARTGEVKKLCTLLGVSRSGYYAYLKRKGNDRDAEAKHLICRVHQRYDGKYGYRQLQLFLLQDEGVWMNHKKILRLMQMLGLQASIRRNRRMNMTYRAAERVAANLLERKFIAEKRNQKWVTDVTQYRVGERWIYLSATKDSSARLTLTTTCCQRLVPKSACLVGAIVWTTPPWRASSRISKRKGSTLIYPKSGRGTKSN